MVNWHLNAPIEKKQPWKVSNTAGFNCLIDAKHEPKMGSLPSLRSWEAFQSEHEDSCNKNLPGITMTILLLPLMTTSGNVFSKAKNSAYFQLDHFPRGAIFYPHGGRTLPSCWPMEHWVQPLGHSKRARFAMARRSGVHGEHGWESRTSGKRGSVQHHLNCNK